MSNYEQMPATSALALMDMTKPQRKAFAEQVIEAIENGKVSPLKVHCQVKAMENLLKQFTDKKEGGALAEKYSAHLLEEAQRNGKTFEYHNGTFTIKEAGHKYDWSQCGDAQLLADMQQAEELEARIKERQEFLKKVPAKGLTSVDQETGEAVTLYPPAVKSTTTVSVTLK